MNSSAPRQMFFSGLFFWIIIAGFCLFSIWPPKDKLRFGIDLKGGSYLTLKVETDSAVESELRAFLQGVIKKLKSANKQLPTKKVVQKKGKEFQKNQIILTFADASAAQEALVALKKISAGMNISITDKQIILGFAEARESQIEKDAVRTNIEVLRTRLGKLMSAAEITIAVQGERNIIVELPGEVDPVKARSMIGRRAVLEFKMVERSGSSEDDIAYEYDGQIPDDMEVLKEAKDGDGSVTYHLVPKYTDITGRMLVGARSRLGGTFGNQHVIEFKFSSEGGEKFYDLTSRNFGRFLAVVLDNEIVMAARIQAAISTEGVITGRFSSEEAREMAMLLRSGSLIAPIKVDGEQSIAATLGASAIRQGLIACIVGLGLLFLFSLFYYSLSGFFAFIALMFNLSLVLFGLFALNEVLTLPGIAGMILTVGMAIDASILIFERIKDGLKEGLSVKKAVNTGFSNAMVVILDANITTFIVGLVLYYFGTGPLQGFAVTMMLGIVATLVTGLFFMRALFNFFLSNFNVQKLRI